MNGSDDKRAPLGLYSIDNFTVGQFLPGHSGFAVTLHKDVAAALLHGEKRPADCELLKMMNEEIVRAFGETQAKYVKPEFFGDTWLLTKIGVPGDASYISLGGDQLSEIESAARSGGLRRHLKYEPHNVDSLAQSGCLLSQWLVWFNSVVVLTGFDLPSRAGL